MKKLLRPFVTLAAFSLASLAYAEPKAVEVISDDTMRFNVETIQAEAGSELQITLVNNGKLPKQAMGHNFVVLKPGTDLQAFANSALTAAATDYVPQSGVSAEFVLGHTRLLGPGESDTVAITFEEPGVYPFLCSFPGHWTLMKGTIVVE